MISKIVLGAAASAALVFAASAGAQTPPTNDATGLPYCSAKVKDRCIQKSDLKGGKPAPKAM